MSENNGFFGGVFGSSGGSSGGGSSDTIYTADGTLSGNRIVDLNSNQLSFDNATGSLIIIKDDGTLELGLSSNAGSKFEVAVGNLANATGATAIAIGYNSQSTSDFTVAMGRNANSTHIRSVIIGAQSSSGGSGATVLGYGVTAGANGTSVGYISDAGTSATALGNTTQATGLGSIALGNKAKATGVRSMMFSNDGDTVTNSVDKSLAISFDQSGHTFFAGLTADSYFNGSGNFGFGTTSPTGKLTVQGNGTSTGSTLALYDNDTTPNKTWEWLDNGNVNIGQNSIVDLDNKKITFDAGTLASGTSNDLGLIIDGSNITRTGSTASPLLRVDGDLGEVFNVNSGGYFNTVSDYTDFIAQMKNRAGTRGFLLKGTLCDLASTNFRHVGALNNTANRIDQYVSSSFQQWVMTDNNVNNHWIRNGDAIAQASFFIEGITGRGFNVGGGLPIGTEDISLQGETLISKKLELSTTTDGFLMPRLTTAQKNAISSPDTNLMVFDTDLNSLQRYNGSAWVDVSSGGDSIYTADGTVSADRTVDLDNKKLTFDAGTLASGTNANIGVFVDGSNIFNGGGSNSSPLLTVDGELGNILNVNSGGYLISNSDYNNNIALFQKRGTNQGFAINPTMHTIGTFITQHKPLLNSNSNQMIQQAVSTSTVDFQMVDADGATGNFPDVKHWLSHGNTLAQASFFRTGFSGRGFIVGAQLKLGTENISLQGSTLIKGEGTSTGSTLALYNNDTTPSKTWEWLDNGNVNIGQDTTFDLGGTNDLIFNNSGASSNFRINAGENGYSLFNRSGGLKVRPSLAGNQPLVISNTSDNFNTFTIKANGGGDWSAYNGVKIGELTLNDYAKFTISALDFFNSGVLTHSIGFENNGSDVYFHASGVSQTKFFAIGSNSIVGTESISLQGATLINDTLDMNNNRILNAVVNPSVQETTSSATFTINSDQQSDGVLTAMAVATTIAIPTGTPVQSQSLIFRFKDDGTARAITWNAIFRAIGITLPTTTTASKLLYVGCKYNSTDTKWDVVSVQEEA